MPQECQLTEILQSFYGASRMSIDRDFAEIFMVSQECQLSEMCGVFMVPKECQLSEILRRFYGAPRMSIYRDFAEILWRLKNVNLQRFYTVRLNLLSLSKGQIYKHS